MQHKHILNNIILVQEAIHSSKEGGEIGTSLKLDMANAFDRINRSFLFLVLEKSGFNNEFILWINACIGAP